MTDTTQPEKETPMKHHWIDNYEFIANGNHRGVLACKVCGKHLGGVLEPGAGLAVYYELAKAHEAEGHQLPAFAGSFASITPSHGGWAVWLTPHKREHYEVEHGEWPTNESMILAPYGETTFADYAEAAAFLKRNLPDEGVTGQ